MTARRVTERIAHSLLFLATIAVLLPVVGILVALVWKAWPALSWEFITTAPREGNRAGGIMPAIVGTVILVMGTLVIALPVGVAAAIYLHEYARDTRWTRLIRLAILNLAGVPSIVHGLFGLALFVLFLDFGTSILAGSATLAILILPLIISASEEALRTVPSSLREASFALGATRWQTVWRAVFPNAIPGILTGAILGIGRAAGETAPILFTVAAFGLAQLPDSPFDQVMALPYHLYVMATQVTRVPQALPYAIATVLIGVVIGLNIVAIIVRARFRRRARAH
jgi:phosphate transport system permease protein